MRWAFLILLAVAGLTILMVWLLKKYVLKVDYKEYSSSSDRLSKLIKREEIEEDNDKHEEN